MIKFKIYASATELPLAWDALPVSDIFLKTPFLRALEQSSPSNITTSFVCIFSSEMLVGISILQRVELIADDIFRKISDSRIKELGKRLAAKFLKGNIIVVGNLMHTGQHGLYFSAEAIKQDEFLESVLKAVNQLALTIKNNFGKKVRIIAFKDFFETDVIHTSSAVLKRHQFFKARVQPNMIFSKRVVWNTAEDYVAAFNKKYRRRYRTAKKKKEPIVFRELDLEAVRDYSKDLYSLYENVSDNAGVNSFKLHPNHFYELKLQLTNDIKLFGYFIDNTLVGFFTLIKNQNNLETYFLGYDSKLQQEHQMYLNMLFDMAAFGVENNFKNVVFARTAMEIKSSIGAKPHDMSIYLKHTNTLIANRILRNLVKFMNPVRDWGERHPF